MSHNIKLDLNKDDIDRIINGMKQNKPFIRLASKDQIYDPGFETKPLEGYEEWKPKSFPECCSFHQHASKSVKKWFKEFPECCDDHRKLAKRKSFNIEDYTARDNKILNQLSYTEYHIFKQIDTSDWYNDITHYIVYNLQSFGTPSVGMDRYWKYLRIFIENPSKESVLYHRRDKQQKLIEYLEKETQPVIKPQNDKDINKLLATYQKWLKIFPDLEYFKLIKEKAAKQIPLLYDKEYNPYLELYKFRIRTQSELIEFLTDATKLILDSIDLEKLILKKVISDAQKYEYEIKREHHRIKQSSLLQEFTKGEKQYVKTIKRWLQEEKRYFKEVEPLFSTIPKLVGTSLKTPLSKKQKVLSFLDLFKTNQDRIDRLFILLEKPEIKAIDENSTWIYNQRKSSIVACFQALEDLGYIKTNLSKAALQRIIATKITFEGNDKLFRNSYNTDDYNHLYKLFKNQLA